MTTVSEYLGIKKINQDATDEIEKLIFKHRPICNLHPDEEFYPITIESYLDNTIMRKMKGDKPNIKDDDKFRFDSTDINKKFGEEGFLEGENGYFVPKNYNDDGVETDYIFKNKINQELIDSIDSKSRLPLEGKFLENIPFYILKNENSDKTKLYVSYCFLYGYNGAAKMLNNLIKIEDHFCDIEHITIEFTKTSGNYEIETIYFAAHSGGELIKKDKLDSVTIRENGKMRPIVYTGINSHASYTKAGVYFRLGGYGNDVTAKGGVVWNPSSLQLIEQTGTARLFKYRGVLGLKGSIALRGKDSRSDTSVGSFGGKKWSGNPDPNLGGNTEIEDKQGLYINEKLYDFLIIFFIISTKILDSSFKNILILRIFIGIFSFYIGSIIKKNSQSIFSFIFNLLYYILTHFDKISSLSIFNKFR